MEKNNLPGLSPLWLILLATLLGAFLPFMVAATMSAEQIKPADWIGFSGSILTTGVAVAAIYYAWKGIIRQLRITLISREEDRIERDLPGLRDANERLRTILAKLSGRNPGGAEEVLNSYNLGQSTWNIVREVEHLFPITDDRTRRQIAQIFSRLIPNISQAKVVWDRLILAEERLGDIDNVNPSYHEGVRSDKVDLEGSFDRRMSLVHSDLATLKTFNDELAARIERFEKSLPRLRFEIEQFFER